MTRDAQLLLGAVCHKHPEPPESQWTKINYFQQSQWSWYILYTEKLSVPCDAVPLKLCCSYSSKTLGKGGHNPVSPQAGRVGT